MGKTEVRQQDDKEINGAKGGCTDTSYFHKRNAAPPSWQVW
jgi:hypothetical protein